MGMEGPESWPQSSGAPRLGCSWWAHAGGLQAAPPALTPSSRHNWFGFCGCTNSHGKLVFLWEPCRWAKIGAYLSTPMPPLPWAHTGGCVLPPQPPDIPPVPRRCPGPRLLPPPWRSPLRQRRALVPAQRQGAQPLRGGGARGRPHSGAGALPRPERPHVPLLQEAQQGLRPQLG